MRALNCCWIFCMCVVGHAFCIQHQPQHTIRTPYTTESPDYLLLYLGGKEG